MGVRLPAEYQEVEWIENTRDKSYWAFDIDSVPTVYKVRLCNSTGESWTGLSFTSAKSAYKDRFTIERKSNNEPFFRFASYVNDREVTAISSVTNNTLSSLCEYDEGVCRVNSTIIGTLSMSGFVAHALNIGGTVQAKRQTRFYFYEDRDRDLIPCYRKNDGIKGIYDLVSGSFNAGEGDQADFTVGPDVIGHISPLMVAWRRIMMAAASVKRLVKQIITSTTGLVSFDTNVEMPTKVTCEFSPIQEGTGDPSPDNVRPISGWTGCEISSGKITLPEEKYGWIPGYLANNAGGIGSQAPRRLEFTSDYIPVNGGETINLSYKLASKPPDANWYSYLAFDKNKQPVGSRSSNLRSYVTELTELFTLEQNAAYFRLSLRTYGMVIALDINDSNTSIPITFTDPSTGDPMTVYGSTVTLNEDGSADLSVTQYGVTIDSSTPISSARNNSSGRFRVYYNMGSKMFPAWSGLMYSVGSINHNSTSAAYANYNQAFTDGTNVGIMPPSTVQDSTSYLAWLDELGSITAVFPLVTPQTYHFSNIGQLQSFLGTNNIWHNMNGDITVEYWKNQ